MPDIKLFSGVNSTYLAAKIADHYGYPLGKSQLNKFSDGEMQVVINESVRGAYVFFINSTFAPSENLFELLLMIDTAKKSIRRLYYGSNSLLWLCPPRQKRQTKSSNFC